MARLTANDILNKQFTPTRYREGYDIVEVDDFLDEVVQSVLGLEQEANGLREQLSAAEQRIADFNDSAAVAPVDGDASEQLARAEQRIAELSEELAAATQQAADAERRAAEAEERAAAQPEEQHSEEPVEEVAPVVQPAVSGNQSEPEAATGMLHLAQRLHDEYVNNGREEGQRLVEEARAEGQRIVGEAEEEKRTILEALEQDRGLLQRKIDELRMFERDYRTKLSGYLEGLLGDLSAAAVQPEQLSSYTSREL